MITAKEANTLIINEKLKLIEQQIINECKRESKSLKLDEKIPGKLKDILVSYGYTIKNINLLVTS